MDIPGNLKYSQTHEWVLDNGDGTVTLGITDYAQAELGDITYLELPDVGRELTFDDPFGTVESVKAASELIAPVTGVITELNQPVLDDPEVINGDPYGSWMLKVRLSNAAELENLLTASDYAEFTEA